MKSKKTQKIAKKLSNLFSCENSEDKRCSCCCNIFCNNCDCDSCDNCDDNNNDDECICSVIESIAMIETSLSHILNAEGEKLQKAVQISNNICDLLEINKNVTDTIREITELEFVLNRKLETVLSKNREEGGENCGNNIR